MKKLMKDIFSKLIYNIQKTYESAKLSTLRALVPYVPHILRTLVLYVPPALHALIPHVPRSLRALLLHVPHRLCALEPYLSRDLRGMSFMCSRASHASCRTYSCVLRSLYPTCSRVLRVLMPYVPRAIRTLVPHVLSDPVLHVLRALCDLVPLAPYKPFFLTYPVVSYLAYSMC